MLRDCCGIAAECCGMRIWCQVGYADPTFAVWRQELVQSSKQSVGGIARIVPLDAIHQLMRLRV